MTSHHLDSMKTLQSQLGEILDALHADPGRAAAALANPILAVEEAGYTLAPEVIAEIDDRSRYPTKDIAVRRRLRKQIEEHLGGDVDVTSESDLAGRLHSPSSR